MSKMDENNLKCSFCGRSQSVVDRLIAGNDAYICSDCVSLCVDMMQNELLEERTPAMDLGLSAEHLPTPVEMKQKTLYPWRCITTISGFCMGIREMWSCKRAISFSLARRERGKPCLHRHWQRCWMFHSRLQMLRP